MRAEVSVVQEAQLDLLHQVFRDERPKQAQAESVLQRPPQPLDQRDGALLSDCPKPLLHSEPKELPTKDPAREAARPIRYEVCRSSRPLGGPRNEPGDVNGGSLLGKHPGRGRHSRERIEDDCRLERHEPEQAFHVCQIHHPDVIRALCPYGSPRPPRPPPPRGGRARRPPPSVP